MLERVKKRIYEIMEIQAKGDEPAHIFDIFMLAIIALNVAVVMLETVAYIEANYFFYLHVIDVISVAIFSVEYALRMWVSTENPRFQHPFFGRVRHSVTPMALVDLFAILPFYIPFLIAIDLRFIRILRLFRIIRILKMGHYSESIKTFERVFSKRWHELTMAFFAILVILVLCSSVMYYAEHEAQPDKFSSIPESLWWGTITLATIGYGDVYPITPLGKFIGALIALLGIAIYALPAGIISAGFVEEIYTHKKQKEEVICPHCGKSFDKPPAPEDYMIRNLESTIDKK
ncbi:MAG: ion transporter [Methanomicrobiales archaeon]|nr:ion transporter [Methanomicrobiales archaeon]